MNGCGRHWLSPPNLVVRLVGLGLAVAMTLAAGGSASTDDRFSTPNFGSAARSPNAFKTCKNQTYALCAVASCFVFNELAYCKCDVKSGDSISLPFEFDAGQDVCGVNAKGAANGYMVSTFSVPGSVLAPDGDQAIYTCPARTSDGAYAQCDGGICFTSTEGQSFPGFEQPLRQDQIICSCPITTAHPRTAKVGYQIAGPYPCQKSFSRTARRRRPTRRLARRSMLALQPGPPAFWPSSSPAPINAPTSAARQATKPRPL